MVAAVIYLCLLSGQCQSMTVRVEPKACHLPAYNAEAPINGAWRKAIITIKCRGKK